MSRLGMVRLVRVGLLTREWPPDVYGGAGVHVEFLARELRSLVDLRVEAFAEHPAWDRLREVVFAAWRSYGLDGAIGRRLGTLLRGAGLVDVPIEAHLLMDAGSGPPRARVPARVRARPSSTGSPRSGRRAPSPPAGPGRSP